MNFEKRYQHAMARDYTKYLFEKPFNIFFMKEK